MIAQQDNRNSGKSKWGEKLFSLCLLFFSLYSFCRFFVDSGNLTRLLEKKSLCAVGEVGILFLYCLAVFIVKRCRKKFREKSEAESEKKVEGKFGRESLLSEKARFSYFAFFLFPLLLSAYLHRFLLPLLVSFLYFFFLASLFGFLLSGSFAYFGRKLRAFLSSVSCNYSLLFVLPFILIQVNRSNIALDYDSLRYGLRSAYILFSPEKGSHGVFSVLQAFFSTHGMLNAVYSYPKGLELLTAPLSFLPGYGFLLAFQIWIYLSIALFLYLLARKRSGKPTLFLFFFFFLSSVGNMAITAKTDNLTLLVQLMSLYFYERGERKNSLAMLLFSYSLKPTAVVFSTLLLIGFFFDSLLSGKLASFFFFKKEGKKHFSLLGSPREGSTPLFLCALFFTSIVTLRSFLITGLPFSTTFTGIFKAIGFQVKWPFNLDAHVDYSGEKGGGEVLFSLVKRVFCFLFYPVGEDMAHVSIAWSGAAFPFLLYLAFRQVFRELCCKASACCSFVRGKFAKNAVQRSAGSSDSGVLLPVFLLLTFFSILSFLMLWQVDGNYYILWECLALLLAFSGPETSFSPFRKMIFPFLYVAAVLTTLVTSWAGAVGFTPIDPINKGYYDHFSVEMEKQAERGSLPLFLKMAENPRNHVIAVSETPECFRIPCAVESITDVEGSGGSPGLYDDPLYFAWFLKWAKTDYIYMEKSFLEEEREERAKEMLIQMANLGILTEPEFANLTKKQESLPEYLLVKVNQPRLEYAWREEPYPALSSKERKDADTVSEWIERRAK